jgi:hypothetical protein
MLVACILYPIYPRGMKMIAQTVSVVKRPICPTFIHDDPTRIFIILIGLLILSAITAKILRYYNE